MDNAPSSAIPGGLDPGLDDVDRPLADEIPAIKPNEDQAVERSNGSDDGPQRRLSERLKHPKIKELSRRTKDRTKKIFGVEPDKKDDKKIAEQGATSPSESDDPLETLHDNPAFNPGQLFGDHRNIVTKTLDSTTAPFLNIKSALTNPKKFSKNKAAGKLATNEQPYISRQQDEVFLKAYDELEDARARRSSQGSVGDGDVDRKEDIIQSIEDRRLGMRVAWLTSRYVRRVRVVPDQRFKKPDPSEFKVYDQNGNYQRIKWEAYLGQYLLWATQDYTARYIDDSGKTEFNRDALIGSVERIIMASEPWQDWFSRLRQVYRWEDPPWSAFLYATWMWLWLHDVVISAILMYFVATIVHNRVHGNSVDALRETHKRTMDQGTTAARFGELVGQHGDTKWIDPLINKVGPTAQTQLSDLADFMEVIQNFYEWKWPEKTAQTLFCLGCAIALGLLTPVGFSMRIVTLGCINVFFLGGPVSSPHPEYRHLVMPLNWIFWDIPTSLSWAMVYLRKRADETKTALLKRQAERPGSSKESFHSTATTAVSVDPRQAPSSGSSSATISSVENQTSLDVDYLSFSCTCNHVAGHLVISQNGIRVEKRSFQSMIKEEVYWKCNYDELAELRKFDETTLKMKKWKGIELILKDGQVLTLRTMKQRDEAFNYIIGFSGLGWKVLQPVDKGTAITTSDVEEEFGEGQDDNDDEKVVKQSDPSELAGSDGVEDEKKYDPM